MSASFGSPGPFTVRIPPAGLAPVPGPASDTLAAVAAVCTVHPVALVTSNDQYHLYPEAAFCVGAIVSFVVKSSSKTRWLNPAAAAGAGGTRETAPSPAGDESGIVLPSDASTVGPTSTSRLASVGAAASADEASVREPASTSAPAPACVLEHRTLAAPSASSKARGKKRVFKARTQIPACRTLDRRSNGMRGASTTLWASPLKLCPGPLLAFSVVTRVVRCTDETRTDARLQETPALEARKWTNEH
jgi:hypothetical protein